MMLSINTLQFIASIFILLTGSLILAVFHQGVDRSARFWFYSCLSLGLGWFCLSLRTIAPDFIGYSIAFFLIMYSYFLSSTSIRLLAQKENDPKAWQIGFCGFFALTSLALVLTNNGQWIVPVTSIGFIVASIYASLVTAQVRKRISGRFMAAMQYLFIATALFWMLRIVLSSTFQIYPHVDMVLSNWFSLIILLAASLFRNFTYLAIRLSQTYQRQITSTQKELERSREDLQIAAVAFETQEGVIITDHMRTIQKVNQAFTKITGYSAEDVIGKPAQILASSHCDQELYDLIDQELKNHDTWQGELYQKRKDGENYPIWLSISVVKDEVGKVKHHVATFTDLTDQKQLQEANYKLSNYDVLTNLPNRQAFLLQLKQICQSDAQCNGAIFYIDLDQFNVLNNSYGIEAGDLLLQKVAKRLTECQAIKGNVARLGGDEFAVLLECMPENPIHTSAEVHAALTAVQRIFEVPFHLQTLQYQCQVSIGITLFSSNDHSPEELLKQAEIAMYQSKKAGRNCAHYFNSAMQSQLLLRTEVEANLRTGLAQHQFCLHYQAQVDEHLNIIGVEALIRLDHPTRGMIFPGQFIGVAEETGLIEPMGNWILNQACSQLALWSKMPAFSHLTIAVNVSARQFANSDFVERVIKALDHNRADPSLLKLEPTESVLLGDSMGAVSKMNALRNKGVRFSLDDFGTGYSSLAYLQKLPLTQLKIDQSFVQELPSDQNAGAIVQTIINLGQNLDLKIIAEGVETVDQRICLEKMGCNLFQGYLFSKPISVLDFENWMLGNGGQITEANLVH